MIMPNQNASNIVHYYAGRYPGKIGWCISPFSWKNPPHYMPYALDNGAFTRWEPDRFLWLLSKSARYHKPLWIVVPDIVGDAEGTLIKWFKWHLRVAPFGQLAFACQDGMTPNDVPPEAYCCFIGGTTKWKLQNAHKFKGVCDWLHVGRVNTKTRLKWAEEIGADSVDGSGFFRGNKNQKAAFIEHFEGSNQMEMFT